MTTARRGLTLIEMLAASVLLAMLAAATVPLIRPLGDQGRAEHAVDMFELARLADRFQADPASRADLSFDGSVREINWHDVMGEEYDEPRSLVRLRVLRAEDPEIRRGWLVFSCGEVHVFRWIGDAATEDERSES